MIPAIQRHLVLPAIELLRGEPISQSLRELERTQWLGREELDALQWRKLQALIGHAYAAVPFYRRRFDEAGLRPDEVRSLEDYARLPPLTKDEVRFNGRELTAPTSRRVEHCHSGGTLGIPLELIRDKSASAFARAVELRALGWFGIRKGDKQVRVWGIPLDAPSARRTRLQDLALNRIRLSPFEITAATVRAHHERVRRFGGRYVYGYPSAIARMCEVMNELGLDGRDLGLHVALCTAETLYHHQRAVIERTLGARVVNEYGCSEVGPIALECPAGSLHLSMENVLAEFVAPRGGAGPREILVTNLNSFSMPLLRYAVGDTGQLLDTPCACGRQLATMGFDAGRVLSMLTATDGTSVSGAVFCYVAFDIIDKHRGIRDFRVKQKARDLLEIAVVKDASFRDEALAAFTARVREKLGADMRLDYHFVPEIPPERSGKRLFVTSEIPEGD